MIVDHFTRYAQAYPTRNKTAKTVADKLYNDYILRFKFPAKIHHDQGGEFENRLLGRLEQLCGVSDCRTTPYHPQGNGQVERFNRTLLDMLRTLPENEKSRWKDRVDKVVHAYNCTRSDTTGFSPFFLLFGRHPRLPIDLIFQTTTPPTKSDYPQYVKKWRKAMQEANQLAEKRTNERAVKAKKTTRIFSMAVGHVKCAAYHLCISIFIYLTLSSQKLWFYSVKSRCCESQHFYVGRIISRPEFYSSITNR